MSKNVEPDDITIWYKLEIYDWVECRQDMLIINYQAKTITTSYDYGDEVGIIVTAPFDKFKLECP